MRTEQIMLSFLLCLPFSWNFDREREREKEKERGKERERELSQGQHSHLVRSFISSICCLRYLLLLLIMAPSPPSRGCLWTLRSIVFLLNLFFWVSTPSDFICPTTSPLFYLFFTLLNSSRVTKWKDKLILQHIYLQKSINSYRIILSIILGAYCNLKTLIILSA